MTTDNNFMKNKNNLNMRIMAFFTILQTSVICVLMEGSWMLIFLHLVCHDRQFC
jgi:hypothetical protein